MRLNIKHLPFPFCCCSTFCKSIQYKLLSSMKTTTIYVWLSLLFLVVSCKQPDIEQIEDSDLIQMLREIHPLHQTNPDSLLVLLDAIWSKNKNSMSTNEKVMYYDVRGHAYQRTHNREAATVAFYKALQYLDGENLRRQGLILSRIANNYTAMGRTQDAINSFRQSYALLKNYQDLLLALYMNKGNSFATQGNIDSAIHYTRLALDRASSENSRLGESRSLGVLGVMYANIRELSQAEKVFRRAVPILKELADYRTLRIAYANLSFLLIDQNRIEEGLIYAQKSNEIAVTIGAPEIAMQQYYTHRGQAYLEESNYHRGLAMFYRALELRTLMPDIRLMAQSKGDLSVAYDRLGNFDRAIYYANEALSIFQEQGLRHLELEVYANLVSIYAARGDMDNFAAALAAERSLRDAVFTEQSARALHQMQVRYETELLNLQIAQQKKDIRRERSTRILVSITLVIVAFLSVVIIFSQRRRMQNALLIVQQYEQLLGVTKEKEAKKRATISSGSQQLSNGLHRLFEEDKIYRRPKLSIAEVVTMLGTNRTRLSALFNQELQKPYADFVNSYRVAEAREMLKNQNEGGEYVQYTIQAIAESVGFTSTSGFYLAFRKEVGVTPTEYQKALKRISPTLV